MGSVQLLKVKVEVFNRTFCNSDESYDGIITPSMFCAGDIQGEHDACQVMKKSCNENLKSISTNGRRHSILMYRVIPVVY